MSQTLYDLLEQAADVNGSRTAVRFGGESITYAELRERSERLATSLARYGAEPGTRVAFCFNKSIDALVAMFAIIRTGAAYVPLDPAWPAERSSVICHDAGISLWTGSKPPIGIDSIRAAIISPLRDAISQERTKGAAREPAEGIANILYTSGSTGRPKGVQITALSLLHFSQWVVDFFELGTDDVVSNHAPYNFDLSTLDIFAAVRAGATMCPVPEKLKMFPYQMAKFMAVERISVWYSVPSALIMMQLRGKLAEHDFRRLRHVIFAGEVMPKPALQAIARDLPPPTYTNLYGPTETNVCTYHRVTAADLASDGPVPIGLPIADTQIWTTEEGELLVAGPTVTTGYFGDGELTAQRLTPAPDGGGTAYRTGDRVQRRGDGVLMFEGRMDRMIKCRGHRIEPGEIEAALMRHPQVREAAVVPMPDPVFGNRIRACLSAREGAKLGEAELIAYCRDRLPPYMLPDEWQFFAALPRTDREKVDLQALASS